MPQVFWILLIPSLAIPCLVATASDIAPLSTVPPPAPVPDCPSMCGDVEIPYPFGIGKECAWPGMDDFTVICNNSLTPPRLYTGNIQIKSISLADGEMRVFTVVSYICYNSANTTEPDGVTDWSLNSTDSPFLISPTRNEFTAIGCNTLAKLHGRADWSYLTGCITYCVSLDDVAHDGDVCTGLGCCQASISGNLSTVDVAWNSGNDTTTMNPAWRYSPCSYAFVAEKGWYSFRRQDLIADGNNSFASRAGEGTIPLVLDWAIRSNGSCRPPLNNSVASAKPTASACVSADSYCVDDPQRNGYLCKCSDGYEGNPYVTGPSGCTNINECKLRKSNPAIYEKLYPCGRHSTCHDTPGSYRCKCKRGYKGDGKTDEGCRPKIPGYAVAVVAIFVAILLLALLLWFVRKERKQRQRRGFFDKNGGKLLEGVEIDVYTVGQLEKMTKKYSSRVGKGNFGNVFMGTTEDNQQVAVKRAIRDGGDKPPEGGDFVHEILFQFQMRHKNLVRLVGCCLETKVPMLVFEFVSSGSLCDVLHGAGKRRAVSLLQRLDIAIGSAEALAYMHSHGHQKRIHGDVKSANILLDDGLSPKVSDFGSSKVVSSKSRYVSFVASDTNYVDPVYMKTGRFTEKSDVYSFGVVLLELITRKAARYDGNNSLPMDFAKSCKVEGNGRKMYDRDIMADDDDESSRVYLECLDSIGALAVRCLKEDVDERPAMAEVLEELKRARAIASGADSYSVSVAAKLKARG